jgi:hypothetical protein
LRYNVSFPLSSALTVPFRRTSGIPAIKPADPAEHGFRRRVRQLRYAQEASWREDCRRMSNGEQVNRIAGLAMASKRSVDFAGYWQRHVKEA